jgi:hypothetical protein
VYLTLDAYLDIVVPKLAKVKFAPRLDVARGINVLDLADHDRFPHELQALVMRSCLEWMYERENNAISIIPEAWEFVPQSRGSPVKQAALQLMRKGAALGNYVWLDSQDIGGIDKEFLRQCPLWLLGVQREINEIKRTLANIPSGIAQPKPAEVAHLERGQFFVCWGKHVIKTYVWPEWLSEESAQLVAQGKCQVPGPVKQKPEARSRKPESEDTVTEKEANDLRQENETLRERVQELEKQLKRKNSALEDGPLAGAVGQDIEGIYQRILDRLLQEPAIIKLQRSKPEMNVTVTRKTVVCDESKLIGIIAILLSEGFLDNATTATAVWNETKRRWNYGGISARCYEQLDKLTKLGFVTKESDGYKAVPDMKINVVKA